MEFAYNPKGLQTQTKNPTINQKINLETLAAILRDPRQVPGYYVNLIALKRKALMGDKSAADEYKLSKGKLAIIIPQGYKQYRTGLDGLTLNGEYINLDIDLTGPDANPKAESIVRRLKLNPIPGLVFIALGPGGHGVKMIRRVRLKDGQPLTLDNYDQVEGQVIAELSKELDIPIKSPSGKSIIDRMGAGKGMFLPYDRPGHEKCAIWPNAEPLVIELLPAEAPGPWKDIELVYGDGEAEDAARYIIESGYSLAECYEEYLKVCFSCARAFGDELGAKYARAILELSENFQSSNFRRDFKKRWRDVINESVKPRSGKKATAGYIIAEAKKRGHKPLESARGEVYKLKRGEYLGDAIERLGLEPERLLTSYIIAGTGVGKTTYIASLASENRRIVVVLPTKIAVQQKAKATAGRAFFGTKETRELDGSENLIYTTLSSLPALTSRIDIADWFVVFDEAHIFSTDGAPEFRGRELYDSWQLAERSKGRGLMTGTPLPDYLPSLRKVPKITFEGQSKGTKKAYHYQTEDVLATVAAIMADSIKRGRLPVMLLNDKGATRDTVAEYLKDYKVVYLDADSKDTDHYLAIVEGNVPKDVSAVFTTTVLREGNDIREGRPVDLIVKGVLHSSTLAQVHARFRDQPDSALHIVQGAKDKPEQKSAWCRDQIATYMIREGNAQLNAFKRIPEGLAPFELAAIKSNLGSAYIRFQNGAPEIDYIAIAAKVTALEAQAEYHNPALQARALEAYGYIVKAGKIKAITDEDRSRKAKEAAKAAKERKRQQYEAKADEIVTSSMPELVAARMRGEVGRRVREIASEYGVTTRDAALLVRDAFSRRDFNLIRDRLAKAKVWANRAYLESDPEALKLDRYVLANIQEGQSLTGAEVLALMKTASAAHNLPGAYLTGPEDAQKRKAIAMLRRFAEIKKVRNKGDRGPHKWRYIIDKVLFYGGPENPVKAPQPGPSTLTPNN